MITKESLALRLEQLVRAREETSTRLNRIEGQILEISTLLRNFETGTEKPKPELKAIT